MLWFFPAHNKRHFKFESCQISLRLCNNARTGNAQQLVSVRSFFGKIINRECANGAASPHYPPTPVHCISQEGRWLGPPHPHPFFYVRTWLSRPSDQRKHPAVYLVQNKDFGQSIPGLLINNVEHNLPSPSAIRRGLPTIPQLHDSAGLIPRQRASTIK